MSEFQSYTVDEFAVSERMSRSMVYKLWSQGKGPQYAPETPGPGASLPEKAKAYGVYCRGESKEHVEGEKGTPFSQCVTAMAKAAKNGNLSTSKACKGLSKKHVKGEKGTEFSRCVVAAAKLKKDETV